MIISLADLEEEFRATVGTKVNKAIIAHLKDKVVRIIQMGIRIKNLGPSNNSRTCTSKQQKKLLN